MVLAVTANLARKRSSAEAWARRVLHSGDPLPDIVFAQEVPDGWTDLWPSALDYRVFSTSTHGWVIRSALITRLPVVADKSGLVSAAYHGSYLQTALVRLDGGDPVRLVSFHASPSPTAETYTQHWPRDLGEVKPRAGGGQWSGRTFDSDYVLATLAHQASVDRRLIAAGDLNECEEWDHVHDQTWWPGIRASLTDANMRLPLRDVFKRELGKPETRTRFVGEHPFQLDHVIATVAEATHVTRAWVDPQWSDVDQVARDGLSDHAPVWFELT